MHTIRDPQLPLVTPLYEPPRDGSEIVIEGHIPHHFDEEFIVELLSGPHIVLHIKFMFRLFGKNLLIMNTCNNGRWDQEVQLDSPLKKGENFHLKIKFEQYGYKIHVNNHENIEFSHRYPFNAIQALGIRGAVTIKEIKFEHFGFEREWGGHYDFGHGGYQGYGTMEYAPPQVDQSFPFYDHFQYIVISRD